MAVILVGTDFSTRSDRALRRAVLLARGDEHELLIVHVIDDDQPRRLLDSQQRAASDLLREMARTITDVDGVPCRTDLCLGRPAEQLPEIAEQADGLLVIIGPHRRSPLKDAFGAVTAERMVRRARRPLLAANGVPVSPYRRLLLPTDFEEASRRTAMAVRSLPIAEAAELSLVHVYDAEAREMLGRAMAAPDERSTYLAERAARARQDLQGFAASAGMEDATLTIEESRGSFSAGIERVAREDGTDLIVLPRSNKGPIEKGIVGSVTENLLRSGELDILVMP